MQENNSRLARSKIRLCSILVLVGASCNQYSCSCVEQQHVGGAFQVGRSEYNLTSFGFCILPKVLRGNSPTNQTCLGFLYEARCSRQHRTTSSSLKFMPGLTIIAAATASPHSISGTPNTAASMTEG